MFVWFLAPSAAAKKSACQLPEASEDKGAGGDGQKKDGLNGEVEEESNGTVKEGEVAACGSKQRACRRTAGADGSESGTSAPSLKAKD